MPQGATVKGQGDSGGMRGGTNAPYGNFILHLTSFLHGHPHLSGAHGPRVVHIPLAVDALWGKKKKEVTAASLRRRLGGAQRLTRKFSILVHSTLNSTRPSLLLPSFCGTSSGAVVC